MALTRHSTGVVIVDDSDPAFTYDPPPAWTRGGVSQEYLGTTHGTSTLAATATFQFNGTAIAVYGTAKSQAISKYAVDDLQTVIFVSPDPVMMTTQYETLFYQSPVLDDGLHRIVITCLSNQTSAVWLDYILYQPSASQNSSIKPSSTQPSSSGNAKANVNTTAIVGGLLGGLLLLSAGLFLLFLMRIRFSATSGKNKPYDPYLRVSPFTQPTDANEHPNPTAQNGSLVPATLPGGIITEQSSRSHTKPSVPYTSQQNMLGLTAVQTQNHSGHFGASPSASLSGDGRQHYDGGVRLDEGPHFRPPHSQMTSSSEGGRSGLGIIPVNTHGRNSISTESRVENGGVTGESIASSLMAPGGVPPAYSFGGY